MEPRNPNAPDSGEPPRGGVDEALRRLEERLGRASEAAERLIAEAAGSVRAAGPARGDAAPAPAGGGVGATPDPAPEAGGAATRPDPPPSGWQIPMHERDLRRDGDLDLVLQLIAGVRDLIPPELQRRLAEALRELLLAIRALIDWYLERTETRRSAGAEVQDIPIA
jgi:hypothetical protein